MANFFKNIWWYLIRCKLVYVIPVHSSGIYRPHIPFHRHYTIYCKSRDLELVDKLMKSTDEVAVTMAMEYILEYNVIDYTENGNMFNMGDSLSKIAFIRNYLYMRDRYNEDIELIKELKNGR